MIALFILMYLYYVGSIKNPIIIIIIIIIV